MASGSKRPLIAGKIAIAVFAGNHAGAIAGSVKMRQLLESRMAFGWFLVLCLFVLSVVIAVGKVSEQTSFGLQIVLGSLATLAGSFAQSVFGNKGDKSND
jgi:hypothetical protein